MKKIIRKYLYSAAPRAYYNILLNALGLNALRTFLYNLIWKMRANFSANHSDPALEELEENGVVVIENFLSDEDYKKMMSLYEKADMQERYAERPDVPQYASKQISTPVKLYDEELANLIINDDRFKKIISSAARKKINVFPKMTLEKFYVNDNKQIEGISPDKSDSLHYDVPFNSIRAFLYLKPCDEDTAAFTYGKGTHKFNSKRMKFEYYDSIKQSVKRSAIASAALDEIDEDLLDEISYQPTVMSGKGNTLVIFNAMGMHKRGKFRKIGSREALLIDYRTLDTPLNFWLGLPVIGKTFNKVIKAVA